MSDTRKTKKQLIDELTQLRSELVEARRQLDYREARNPDDAIRQQVEETLRRSTEELFTTFNVMSDAISLIDADGRIRRCNRAMAQLLDRPLGEILGHYCWEVVHGTSGPIKGCPVVRMRESLRKEALAVQLGDRWFDVSVEPFPAGDGKSIGAVHVMTDITEYVHAEEERARARETLRESQQRLATLMSNLPGMAYRCTDVPGWPMEFVSEGCVELTGYTPAELTDENLLYDDLIYPPDREMVWSEIQEAVRAGEPFVVEYRLRDKQGRERWVWERGRATGEDSAGTTILEGFISDITERKRAEELLERRNRSLALINQANQVFGSTLDLNQVLASVLEQARRLLDIAASSIWLVDSETQELVCHQATGPKYESVVGWRLAPGEGIAGWVTTHGESLVVPDVEEDDRHSGGVSKHIGLPVRSMLSVPLHVKQSVIGVLQMLDVEPGRFDDKDLQSLEPLAASAANAIENSRLYERARQEIEERKQAEEQLRRSEAALKQAQRVAHVGSWRWHVRSNCLEWSDEMYRIFGIEKETFSGELSDVIERAIHPEDRAAVEQSNLSVMQDKKPIPLEYRVIRTDGTIRTVWAEAGELILDAAGEPAALTGIVQDISERKETEVALRGYAERLRTLHAIDGAILAAWSAEDIARAVLRHIRQLIPCQWASVMAIDMEDEEATVLALSSDTETSMEVGTPIPLEMAGVADTARDGQVHVVEDIVALRWPSEIERALLAAGVRSYISVPLIAQGVLVGTLNLGTVEPEGFLPEHVDIASELANQLAIAVQQAHLFERVQRHAEELELQVATRTAELGRRTTQLQVAAEVARDATTAHDLDELLSRSVNLVARRFGFYHAGIFLTDERDEYAAPRAATGEAGRQMLDHGHRLKVGEEGIVGHVCASGEPRISLDVGTDAIHFDNPWLPDTRSEMALPMRVGGRIIGALDVQSSQEAAFDQDDVEILQILADQLAVAIERTRLFEQVQATLEERLHTVVSNVPIVLFALDRDGVFTLSEGKGLDALGVKSGERVGQSAFVLYRDAPEIQDDYRRALAGEVVTEVREQAGAMFDTWWSPLRDANGEISGVIGVATDVTERYRMQEQMQRQERLAAVGQLAGGIAHDFNNFLATIVFYAHLLVHGEDVSQSIVSIGETIMGEAKRAAALVRQVLDFSRRSVMETEPVDVAAFVEEVIDILQETLPENIQVETDVGEGIYVAEIDPTRIQQVIMNLALNSRDAMPKGGKLCIELSKVTVGSSGMKLSGIQDLELTPGDWVCLSVQDTGTGMDEQVRAHLFEPFFTTKGAEGTGLGLAQVYGIVKQHGGEVDVTTEPGRGTTFRIYLPVEAREHAQTDDTGTTEAIPQGRGETILLVEDEGKVREAGRRVLESLGYSVLTATNGLEGLSLFKEADRCDLVLTDMVMPEMGGLELIQELKRIAPGVKALVVTGYISQEDTQVLKDSGLTHIIDKPLDVCILARAVRQILDEDAGSR